jgi:peptide-methionine (R)-S-oxide reductase
MSKITPLSPLEREELAKKLTEEERYVLLQHGTERPFCGTLLDNKKKGTYLQAVQPALVQPDSKVRVRHRMAEFSLQSIRNISGTSSSSLGMRRVEIRCSRCDGHLGHVFPTALRPPARGTASTASQWILSRVDFVTRVLPASALSTRALPGRRSD